MSNTHHQHNRQTMHLAPSIDAMGCFQPQLIRQPARRKPPWPRVAWAALAPAEVGRPQWRLPHAGKHTVIYNNISISIYIHMLAPYKTDKTYLFLYGRNALGSSFPEQSKYCYTVSSVHLYIFCKHWCVLTMNSACLNTKSFPQMLYTFLR